MEGKVFYMIPGSQTPVIVLWCLVAFLSALTIFFAYLACRMNNVSFEITSEALRIRSPLYGRLIPLSAIIKDRVEILDLVKDDSRRPSLRTNGMGLPGYAAGWFRLRNKEKALLFLTANSNVVYIPTSEGYSLLLSVKDAEEFSKELKQ